MTPASLSLRRPRASSRSKPKQSAAIAPLPSLLRSLHISLSDPAHHTPPPTLNCCYLSAPRPVAPPDILTHHTVHACPRPCHRPTAPHRTHPHPGLRAEPPTCPSPTHDRAAHETRACSLRTVMLFYDDVVLRDTHPCPKIPHPPTPHATLRRYPSFHAVGKCIVV